MNDETISVYQDGTGAITGWANITSNSASNYGVTRIVVQGGAGTITTVEAPLKDPSSEKRISPKLYFSYVKSKLATNEIKALKARLSKLQTLTQDAFDLQQQALFEEYSKLMAITVRESEAYVAGYKKWVTIKDIERFRTIAKNPTAYNSPVFFKKLEDFPRSVPKEIKKVIDGVKQKNIFDQLWILYLDYTNENIKTNKEKIREKDPILFGQFAYDKSKYFYITDWVDEFCDLSINDFVNKLSTTSEDYRMNEVSEIDLAFIEKIKKEVKDRQDRLDGTKPSNFQQRMAEEDRNNSRPAPLPPSGPGQDSYPPTSVSLEDVEKILASEKMPWWKRMFGK